MSELKYIPPCKVQMVLEMNNKILDMNAKILERELCPPIVINKEVKNDHN